MVAPDPAATVPARMARKDRTPKPPRQVQAPQQRRNAPASGDALKRQRMILYGIAASGIVGLIVVVAVVLLGGGGGGGGGDAAETLAAKGCTLETVKAVTNKSDHSDVPTPETKVNWNTFPPSNGPHYGSTIIYGSYDEPLQEQPTKRGRFVGLLQRAGDLGRVRLEPALVLQAHHRLLADVPERVLPSISGSP